MNLNQLKLFYLTARYKSPSAAAEFLNVSQPAVTTGIRRLEDHYDVKLFQRDGKTLVRTEAGDALFKQRKKFLKLNSWQKIVFGIFKFKTSSGFKSIRVKPLGPIICLP